MCTINKREKLEPLTEIEKAVAEQYHECVYMFLRMNHYPIEEFYDIVIIGFLKGIQKYCRTPELQEKYAVSTICMYKMKNAVSIHFRALNTLKRKPTGGFVSLDAEYGSDNSSKEGNTLKDCIGIDSFEDDVLDNEMITEILNSLSERQCQIVTMKLNGYNQAEIRSHLHICKATLSKELQEIKSILRDRCGC